MHRIPYEESVSSSRQFFNLKSFLKFIQQYTWMFETDMRLFEYWLFWCSIFQLSSWEKRRIELRYISKRISFLKAIYAQSWWIYFAVVVLNVKEKMRKKEEKLNIQFIFRLSVPPHIWKQDIQKIQPVFSYSLLIFHCQFRYVLFMLYTLQWNDFTISQHVLVTRCSITYGSLNPCFKVFNINFFPFVVLQIFKLAVYWYATFWHYQGVLDHKKLNVFAVKFCFSFRCKHTPLYVDERRKNVSEAIHLDILCNSFNQIYEDVLCIACIKTSEWIK